MKGRGIVSSSWFQKIQIRLFILTFSTFLASNLMIGYSLRRQWNFDIFSFEFRSENRVPFTDTRGMSFVRILSPMTGETITIAYNKTVTREKETHLNVSHNKMIRDYHAKILKLKKSINCSHLFDGNVTEVKRVTSYLDRYKGKGLFKVTLTDVQAKNTFQNCESFTSIRQYRLKASSATEANFPLAYVILLHKGFEQLERLIRALYQPQNVFCIHLDLKASDTLYQAVQAYASCFPNVHLASKRYNVTYAHVTRLLADIQCMKDLSSLKHPWRYLMTTVSTEFPLRSNKENVDIFTMMNGTNGIRETWSTRSEIRFRKKYYVVNGRMKRTNLRKPPAPHNITIVKGRAGNVFSRAFVDWFHKDRMAQDLLEWSMDTYSPDEHYWGTLNDLYHNPFFNTPGGYEGHPDTKRYFMTFAIWVSHKNPKLPCRSISRHNLCIFGAPDLPVVRQQSYLFANKFDIEFDPVAYACMEELIENREKTPRRIDLGPYRQKLPHPRTDAMKKHEKVAKRSPLSKTISNQIFANADSKIKLQTERKEASQKDGVTRKKDEKSQVS